MDDLRPCAGYLRHPEKHAGMRREDIARWFLIAAGRVCPDSCRHYRLDGYTDAMSHAPLTDDEVLAELDRRNNMEWPEVSDKVLFRSLLHIARRLETDGY